MFPSSSPERSVSITVMAGGNNYSHGMRSSRQRITDRLPNGSVPIARGSSDQEHQLPVKYDRGLQNVATHQDLSEERRWPDRCGVCGHAGSDRHRLPDCDSCRWKQCQRPIQCCQEPVDMIDARHICASGSHSYTTVPWTIISTWTVFHWNGLDVSGPGKRLRSRELHGRVLSEVPPSQLPIKNTFPRFFRRFF